MIRSAIFCCAFLMAVPEARAQQCHGTSGLEPEDLGLRAGFATEVASYTNSAGSGSIFGATVFAEWQRDRFFAGAALPIYYLKRDLGSAVGLGDLLIDLRFAVLDMESWKAGAQIAAMLPIAGSDDAFRMGHLMLMPRLWAELRVADFFGFLQAGYGRAIGDHSGHGGGRRPIVAPMNASEIEAALTAGYAVHENVRLRSSVSLAAPVADDGGIFRSALSIGPQLLLGAFDVSADLHLPIAGDPFDVKVIVTTAFRL